MQLPRPPIISLINVVLTGILCTCLSAGDAVVTIDPATTNGPINRLVLGGNLEAEPAGNDLAANRGGGVWDPERRMPVASVIAALRSAGISSLRYPGGCWVHYWDWRQAVGSPDQRPSRRFGLPEFLTVCQELGAEPVITMPDFLTEADEIAVLAGLAAYLRGTAPSDGAAQRKRDGRTEPWPALRFEYGNEGFHGGHRDFGQLFAGQVERRTTADYVRRFHAVRHALRAVDPAIRVGAVLDNDLSDPWTPWTRDVVTGTANDADFFITHLYYPSVGDSDAKGLPLPGVFRTAFAAPRQLERRLTDLRAFIRTSAGRDVPLAITEFNANFSLRSPPLRFSLGAAIEAIDLTRMLLELPGIDCAHYWQSLDGYWGALSTSNGLRPRPAHLGQELLQRHLGSMKLASAVTCSAIESDGGWGVLPARGSAAESGPLGEPRAIGDHWTIGSQDGTQATVNDGTLRIDIRDGKREIDWFQASQTIGVERADRWRITAEVRCGSAVAAGLQLQVGDVRGWDATKSVVLSEPVTSTQWTTISVDYLPLHDTNAISITARRRAARETGTFEVRQIKIQPWRNQSLGATPELGALVTRRVDGAVELLLINRRIDAPLTIKINGLPIASATAEVVTGPSVDATNEDQPLVTNHPLAIAVTAGVATVTLPPHTLAGVTLKSH